MVEARNMLESAPAKIRHMIILSDGYTQPADHHSLAQESADIGITVSTVALGAADKELLSSIAEIGHGRYYETDDPGNVPQIFTKETMQASKSAIKEDIYHLVQTGDHPIFAGFQEADLPFVLGYVMAEVKPTAQLLLSTETGDPLLAIGRYGLGTGLAYTSDLSERWGGEWLSWDSCGKFWAQVLRGTLRKADAAGVQVREEVVDDNWIVTVDRVGEDAMPINAVHWETMTTDEFGRQAPVDMREVGIGRYRAEIPLSGASRLTLRLLDRNLSKLKVLDWQRSYPAEYALAQRSTPALEALKLFPATELHAELMPEPQRHSISHPAYFVALAALLASVLLRRV
jgi:Ca-activated chloride channel family protein